MDPTTESSSAAPDEAASKTVPTMKTAAKASGEAPAKKKKR